MNPRTAESTDTSHPEAARLRRLAGLPAPGIPVRPEEAYQAGRQLARHPLLVGHKSNGRDAVPDAIEDAADLLAVLGVRLEILRVDQGFMALQATPVVGDLPWCPLTRGLLEAIPSLAGSGPGALFEVQCKNRGHEACQFSLSWKRTDIAAQPHAPVPTRANGHAPPAEGGRRAAEPGDEAVDATVITHDAVATDEVVEDVSVTDPLVEAPTSRPEGPDTEQSDPQTLRTHGEGDPGDPPSSAVVPLGEQRPVQTAAETIDHDAAAYNSSKPRRRRGAPWLRRRGWLLVLATLAGATGGWYAGAHHATSYKADSTVVVRSGASTTGPGAANDALALATTYAAIVPTDAPLLRSAARQLGISEATMASRASATVQSGTSVLQLGYAAPTAAASLKGATVLAQTVASSPAASAAIPTGTVAVVHLPTQATASNTLQKYGLPIGAVLGLAVGIILALAAERADPRVDDVESLATAVECPVTSLPGEVREAELARAIALRDDTRAEVTVVPLTASGNRAADDLATRLDAAWPVAMGGRVVAGPPLEGAGPSDLSSGEGPTLLLVAPGDPQRTIVSAVERLKLLGRAPIWAVLTRRSIS